MPPLRTRKGQWLLALLLLRHDRETPRDWLAGTLWPDSDESLALANLRRSLNDLRHALGPEARRLLAPTPRSLRFDTSESFCDIHAFDAAIEAGKREKGKGKSGEEGREDPTPSIRIPEHPNTRTPEHFSLQEAVALYRGPLLEACSEPWIVPERERREQAYLSALQTLAREATQQGQHGDAISFLRRILQVNPLLEAVQIALMEAFAAVGEPAEAIRVYREFRLLLRRELNAEPEARTTALYRRLRNEAGNAGIGYSGIGSSGIQGLSNEEGESPVLNTRYPVSPALVGRERELALIIERLVSSRLVTLTGMGGIGKTRLALATSEEVGDAYSGVWFVPLADLTAPERLLDTVRDALCLPPLSSVDPLHQVRARLAGEKALLVLDNMEQLLPEGAKAVQALLAALPDLSILATSRQLLRLGEEWEIPVPPLALPDAASPPETPEAGLKYPGVELFVARARMRNPEFALTPGNLAPVVALCAALEGIPLATELAAAWTQVLSPAQMHARLAHRFDLLKTRQQDRPTRHHSLYAAMESSYRLLSARNQTFFARLSVFRGGWTLEAAEAVCVEPNALEALADLREASLVVAEESDGEMRFRFLDTVREFAEEQQSDAERQETARRHIAYFLQLAEEATQHLDSAGQMEWQNRLERENENFRAALDWSARAGAEESALGLELAVLLHEFWDRKGYLTEGRQRLVAALESAQAHSGISLRASALRAIGGLCHRLGDLFQAEASLQEALRLSRTHGDRHGEAVALASLGELRGNQGDFEGGRVLLEEALQQYREQGDRRREGEVLGFLGYLAREQKDFATARALTEEALAIHRSLGNRHGISWNLGSLGYVAVGENNKEEAERLFTQALFLNREMQNQSGEAWALTSLAHLARGRGDMTSAITFLQQAVALFRSQNAISSMGWALFELGATQLQQGERTAARSTLQESLYLLTLCGETKISQSVTELLDKIAREAG